MKPSISRSIPKLDNAEKISGRALYVADLQMEGMLHAVTVRSTKAHARITDITVPALPEGYVTVDASDIPGHNIVKMIFDDWPVFATDEVTYIGEPLMLIAGPDRRVLSKLMKDIKIVYEDLPATFGHTESVVTKSFVKGNPAHAFEKASRTVRHTYTTGYQEQAYIEPQGMLAWPEGPAKVTVKGSMQCPYYIKNAVDHMFGEGGPVSRVIQAAVGGAFGGKEEYPSLIACHAALAAVKTGRPVRLIFSREEDMTVTTKRHPSTITMEGALDASGKLTAIKCHVALDGGSRTGLSGVVLSRAMLAVTGAYTVDNLDVSGDVYRTNTVPTGAFRGFGAPQMLFATELFVHDVAIDTGQDPLAFRMRHLARQGDLTSTSGVFREPIIMDEMIRKAREMSGYDTKHALYSDPSVFKGIGMSFFFHGCGFTGDGEAAHIKATVKLEKDGKDIVHILVAAVDMGQGAKTTLTKIVAGVLEIPISGVVFDAPDTDKVPDSGPTVASRTIMVVGGLLARAAKTLKTQWKTGQAQDVTETYRQPEEIVWDEDAMRGDAYPAYAWGVNVVEVEVDKRTFQVDVKGIWSVYDLGKAIDERIVFGQADGGIAQGVAYGYLEVMRHKEGKLLQKTMTDYVIPTSLDMAPTETVLYENPYAYGPYGAKGFGELTLVGGAPAVALAIRQATGCHVRSIPVTPETLMEMSSHD
jgi:CO/xanthine dehydrogenase Mo-binding subunit